MRARPVQPMKERMIVMSKYTLRTGISGGIAALSAIQSGIVGTDWSTSMIRWMIASTSPEVPGDPADGRPQIKVSEEPTNPMDREMLEPRTTRENRSRPMRSVPKMKTAPSPSTP